MLIHLNAAVGDFISHKPKEVKCFSLIMDFTLLKIMGIECDSVNTIPREEDVGVGTLFCFYLSLILNGHSSCKTAFGILVSGIDIRLAQSWLGKSLLCFSCLVCCEVVRV